MMKMEIKDLSKLIEKEVSVFEIKHCLVGEIR